MRSVRRYCEDLERGMSPVDEQEDLTDEQVIMETVSLGLRTRWGFDMKVLPHGTEPHDILSMLEKSGYIHIRDERVIPTKKGFLIADQLPLYFI